jgi:hypothetical protein
MKKRKRKRTRTRMRKKMRMRKKKVVMRKGMKMKPEIRRLTNTKKGVH